jgi:GNAT superfamily N-acetyltransferase
MARSLGRGQEQREASKGVAPSVSVEGVLKDGTRVVFRPVVAEDKELLRIGLDSMSPESRYRRFFAPITQFSDEQLAYLTEIDYQDHFAWIGLLADSGTSQGLGVSRWIRDPDNKASAEAAVTVLDQWQGQGVGSALLVVLARSAIERGVKRFSLEVLGENEPMLALLQSVGAVIDKRDGGVVFLHVPLPDSVEELDQTASPSILRAAAEGRIQGELGDRGLRTRFRI